MTTFLDWFDVTIPLQVVTWWAKRQRGHSAKVALVGYGVCTIIFAWLSWYFDVDTTLQWSQNITNSITKTLAQSLLAWTPLVLICVTVFPTVIRQTLSRASKERMTLSAALIFVLALFDVRTDWPRVRDFCASIYDLFDVFGPVQYLIWLVFRVFWLFMATDGFEIMFVVSFAGTLILAWNSTRKNGKDDDD